MGENTGVRFETVFLGENPPDDDRVNQLIYWGKRFDKLGLVPESAGNLSFRTKQGFIITTTGVALRNAEKKNLTEVLKVEIQESSILVYVEGKVAPSQESILHSQIYDLRPDINAVFHTHDQLVVDLAEKLEMPCTGKEQPHGSYELAKEVVRLLGLRKNVRYFVLKNHGVISMGQTLEAAGRLAESMNKLARKKNQEEESEK